MYLHTQTFPMLPVFIHPSYEGISIRKVMLPRDTGDLLAIHIENDYGPDSLLRPDASTIELLYRRLLGWSLYGAYLLSYRGSTLMLLELMPVGFTDHGYYYDAAPFDYAIDVKLGAGPERMEELVQVLLAALNGIFTENPSIYRLVFRVTYSKPGSLLRRVLETTGFEQLTRKLEVEESVIYIRWR
jgi:hypothetical protein